MKKILGNSLAVAIGIISAFLLLGAIEQDGFSRYKKLSQLSTIGSSGLTTTVAGNLAVSGVLDLASGVELDHVVITDAASYSVLAANSGRTHMVPNMTNACSITLPTERAGLYYHFAYAGGAADAEDDTLFTTGNTNYFVGGVGFHDSGNAISSIYSNGSSNSEFTIVNKAGGTSFEVWCDGTNWYITGNIVSDTTPTFQDQ